jgi:Helix-turn-helix
MPAEGAERMEPIRQALTKSIRGAGKTQAAIARGSGVPEWTLSRFLAGEIIKLDQAEKLADYFGLQLVPRKPPRRAHRKGR